MLAALKTDADILFYNIFGMVEVLGDKIRVTATVIRAGKPQTRTVTEETKLKNAPAAVVIPFGAWLDGDTPHVGFTSLEGYEDETFKSNIVKIEKAVRDTVLLFKGILE